jgi:hypothetical protein
MNKGANQMTYTIKCGFTPGYDGLPGYWKVIITDETGKVTDDQSFDDRKEAARYVKDMHEFLSL